MLTEKKEVARPGTTLLVVAVGLICCAPDGIRISIKRDEFEYICCGKIVTDGAMCACSFGATLLTVVMSWLTNDGLCCGKRQ